MTRLRIFTLQSQKTSEGMLRDLWQLFVFSLEGFGAGDEFLAQGVAAIPIPRVLVLQVPLWVLCASQGCLQPAP